MSSRTDHTTAQKRVAALCLLALLASLVWLTIALYNQDFTAKAFVMVRTDRAGLQMRKGTVVSLRGVDVGKIYSAREMPDGTAEIELAMKPDMLSQIPANVTVSLAQLTAFGNKAVLLSEPTDPSNTHLAAGDVIDASHVSVEVNQVFDDLVHVLQAAHPAEVDAALSSVAGALDGKGEQLGRTLTTANDYLARINNDMPTLKADFEKGSQVMAVYADIMPNLMTTLSNMSAIGQTISANSPQLESTLTSVAAVSDSGGRFLAINGDQLAALLARTTVTTQLLAKYSPEYACLLKSQDWYQQHVQGAYGGLYPGARVWIPFEQGTAPYTNPANLPNISAHNGPQCYGMPNYRGGPLPSAVLNWKDPSGNTWPQKPQLNNQPLAVQLFGPLLTHLGGSK